MLQETISLQPVDQVKIMTILDKQLPLDLIKKLVEARMRKNDEAAQQKELLCSLTNITGLFKSQQ